MTCVISRSSYPHTCNVVHRFETGTENFVDKESVGDWYPPYWVLFTGVSRTFTRVPINASVKAPGSSYLILHSVRTVYPYKITEVPKEYDTLPWRGLLSVSSWEIYTPCFVLGENDLSFPV